MFVNWRNVKLILMRELRDQLRDRRTLFMVFVLPLLLYPTLGIGMLQLTMLFSEQPRTVVLLGEEYLPPPPLLEGDQFVKGLFHDPKHADKLHVVTSSSLKNAPENEATAKSRELLSMGRALAKKLAQRDQLRLKVKQELAQDNKSAALRTQQQVQTLQADLSNQFAECGIQVLILIPTDFRAQLERFNEALTSRKLGQEIPDYPRPVVIHNKADEKSLVAYNRTLEAISAWEDKILLKRLQVAGLPLGFPKPVAPIREDLASEIQLDAMMWSKLFPALLVIMSMTGAFYPAIDLCAGEKERGTMETLLICPAKRIEIVLGKFLTVLCFSVATAVLNLVSIGMTGQHMASLAQRNGAQAMGTPDFPPWYALGWIVLLLLPLATMFSALCLSLATFARSSKEGQYYLTPLLMVTLGLTVFCSSPGVELSAFYSVMPIAGVALLLKGLLLNPHDGVLYLYAIPVLITSIGYSALSLWWSIDQFQREDVLFREAERFELKLWLRHLLRDKEATPIFAQAVFCFVLIMLLQFGSFRFLSQTAPDGSGQLDILQTLKVLMTQQMAFIASPALLMGIMLTTSVYQTFRLRLPSPRMILAAFLLAISAHPLTMALSMSMNWFFPPLPEGISQLLSGINDPRLPLWIVLVVFALTPGVCEEIAFRGFILSGLNHGGRTRLAIVLSSLAFGLMHMIPQQVFNAALMGLLLAVIAVRSNSIWPGILLHSIYNGLAVIHGRISHLLGTHTVADNPFYTLASGGQIIYGWATLCCAAVVFAIGLMLLIKKQPMASTASPDVPGLLLGQSLVSQ